MPRHFLLPSLFLVLAPAAHAETAKLLAKSGDWEAYAYGSGSAKVCYAASLAKKTSGEVPGRKGTSYVMVTHGPGKAANVPSIDLGFAAKEGSEAEAVMGNESVSFYTSGDTAWARSGDETRFMKALQKEKTLTVKSVPAKGKPVTDTYSLAGFKEAYQAIGKACGVK